MQMKFFHIPVQDSEVFGNELNSFFNAHRILGVERRFVEDAANSFWAICVNYEPVGDGAAAHTAQSGKRSKIDYKEVLSDEDFTVYARLLSLRKEIAESEGVPVYALFTNEHLAEMVARRVTSAAALRELSGVGQARVEKYGKAFLALLEEAIDRLPPPPSGTASE